MTVSGTSPGPGAPPALLAVLAHPDDESGISGTLAAASARGWRVILACATLGEAGEIADPALASPENLGEVRQAELRAALEVLGVRELRLLGYCDSGMPGSDLNQQPDSLHRADPATVIGQIADLMHEFRPRVVITFEPHGIYGHPDHVAISRYTTAAFERALNSAGSPVEVASLSLYYFALPTYWVARGRARLEKLGLDAGGFEELAQQLDPALDRQITHTVDVSEYAERKVASLNCHRTQLGPGSPFQHLVKPAMQDLHATEFFIQVHPPPEPGAAMQADILAGS
jgi:LmbE family N-acetylglucosaminyl deacetylase